MKQDIKKNMLLKSSICLWLVLTMFAATSYMSAAQLDIWPNLKQLDLKFSIDDDKRINKIEEQKENAVILIYRALEEENLKLLKEAFNELFSANNALFDIYDKYCKKALANLPETLPAEFNIPVELERRAKLNMDKAEIIRTEAVKAEGVIKFRSIYLMAYDLELLALLSKGRALRIYQDYPIIYAYPWHEDFTIMNESPERAIRVVQVDQDEQPAETIKREEEDPLKKEGVFYIIQIAAHTDQLSESYLNSLYRGDEKLNMMYDDGWYKYYFGPFNIFEEAEKVMNSLNIRNVFIAAYINGQRIGVGEARRKQEQQN